MFEGLIDGENLTGRKGERETEGNLTKRKFAIGLNPLVSELVNPWTVEPPRRLSLSLSLLTHGFGCPQSKSPHSSVN